MYKCSKCGGNCDAGELIGGICPDCLEEQEKKEKTFDRYLFMITANAEQMELFGGNYGR